MLRRRRKTPKAPASDRVAPRVPGAPVARRRARSDAHVPAELLIKGARHETHETPAPAALTPARSPKGEVARSSHGNREVVLVTGFEPFGGEKVNPSWDICAHLGGEIAGMRVETCRVPCEFRRSVQVVAEAIERLRPALVICLGQAGGRSRLGVERVALNVDDARAPDNCGARPIDEPIVPGGPPAYFATLPIKAMAAAMRAAGAPAEVSNSAGTYVCNHLMYGVLHCLAASGNSARAGFIHVPWSEWQVLDKRGSPCMSLATMVVGVCAAIAAAREHREDIRESEGQLQ